MTLGLAETRWAFEVSEGATGHVKVGAHDLATGQAAIGPDACIAYEIFGPWCHEEGNEGSDCSAWNLVVQTPGAGAPRAHLEWMELREGRYVITAEGQPQPNELVVDIVVDNP